MGFYYKCSKGLEYRFSFFFLIQICNESFTNQFFAVILGYGV